MADEISLENLSTNEKLIYHAARDAFHDEIQEYFGMNGAQHKLDHKETIPKIKEFLATKEAELISKNKFWDEIRKDLYKFLVKFIAVGFIGLVLVSLGIINWSTLIKFIG